MHIQVNTTLKTVTDKTGKDVVVKYCEYIGAGPKSLLAFYYRNMADAIDEGYTHTTVEIHDKCKAVYVEIDDKIVGTCVVEWRSSIQSLYVVFTAIDKEYRGRGLYKIIFYFLEQKARELGAGEITSIININNETSINARKSVGMMPVTVYTKKRIAY